MKKLKIIKIALMILWGVLIIATWLKYGYGAGVIVWIAGVISGVACAIEVFEEEPEDELWEDEDHGED